MSLKTLLVVNTLWYLSTDVQGQGMGMGPCQSSVDFDSLPAPSEAAPQIKYASAIAGYYNTPRAFIDSVRSGILPYVKVRDVLCARGIADCGREGSGSQADSGGDSKGVQALLRLSALPQLVNDFSDWLIPVLATVALGLLLAVLFPCVGFCFCCCWLCGSCGASAHKYRAKNQGVKCSICTILLLSAEAMVFIGMIFGFLSNQQISEGITAFRTRAEVALNDSVSYITDTVQEVMFVSTDQFAVAADAITCNVDNPGTVLGDSVEGALDAATEPVFDSIMELLDTIDYLQSGLSSLNSSNRQLILMTEQFNTSASELNQQLTNLSIACSTVCIACDCPSLQSIDTEVVSSMNSLNDFTSPLNSLESINVPEVREMVGNVTDIISTIGDSFNEEAMNIDINSTLNEVRDALINITTDIQNAVNDATSEEGIIGDIESTLLNALDTISTYDAIRNGVLVGLFALIGGIMLVFTCGVFCGIFVYSGKALPHERSSISHCGAMLLLIAITLCFLTAGLFLVLAALQFLVGAGIQKICNDLRPPDYTLIKEILDNPSVWSGSTLIGSLTPLNLSISDFLKQCDANGPLWRAANVESAIDLNSLLSNLTQELQQLSSENLDLSTVNITSEDFISDGSRSSLENIQSSVLDNINCSEYREILNKSITVGDTGQLLQNLTELADSFDALNETESRNLTLAAIATLNATTKLALEIQNQIEYLSSNCTQIQWDPQNISASVTDTFSELDAFLNATNDIVLNEVELFLDMFLGPLADYLDYTADSIRNEIGRCERVSLAYTSIHTGVCDEILDGFNGVWFSLGWCMLFFVPAIVSGIVLTIFFRRSASDIKKLSKDKKSETYANAQVVGTRYTEHPKNRLNGTNVAYHSNLPPMDTPLNVPTDGYW